MKNGIKALIFFLFLIACNRKETLNNIQMKSIVPDIVFPSDLVAPSDLYTIENSPDEIKKIKSGYYNTISGIFNYEATTDKSSKFYVSKEDDNSKTRIKIYSVSQLHNDGNCSDCLPLYDCFYFDGRYAVITEEDEFKRVLIDLKEGLNLLITYTNDDIKDIEKVTALDESLLPVFYFEEGEGTIEYFKIKNDIVKQIKFEDNFNKRKLNEFKYSEIVLLSKLYSQKKFNLF